jgi:peptidoglycan hydrolase CwlO-like protein
MKQLIRYSIFSVLTLAFLSSCEESRERATKKFNELSQQADDINSEIDKGLEKVESLDSVVRSETQQIKEYDSIIKNSSSKIDSIAKQKTKAWEELTSF